MLCFMGKDIVGFRSKDEILFLNNFAIYFQEELKPKLKQLDSTVLSLIQHYFPNLPHINFTLY
jgi:hypothetical protein